MSPTGFDVFLSYAWEDAHWVRVLAVNLREAGLEVFLDEWEIGPGELFVHRLEEGLTSSRSCVLVVSPASMGRAWVAEEYATMIRRAVTDGLRLIPVLYGDARDAHPAREPDVGRFPGRGRRHLRAPGSRAGGCPPR